MKIRYTILWCSFLFILTWGCTTIEKFFSKQKESTESKTYTKTEKIETSQKDLQVVGGVSLRFDTGCKNTVVYNASTGHLEASGGIVGATVNHDRKEAAKEAKSEKGLVITNNRHDVTTIHKQTVKKVIPWWVYLVGGLAAVIAVYSLLRKLNPIKKFYPF